MNLLTILKHIIVIFYLKLIAIILIDIMFFASPEQFVKCRLNRFSTGQSIFKIVQFDLINLTYVQIDLLK